jgi:hypothetical protein
MKLAGKKIRRSGLDAPNLAEAKTPSALGFQTIVSH